MTHQWKMEEVTLFLLHTTLLRGTTAWKGSEGTLVADVHRRLRHDIQSPDGEPLSLLDVAEKIREMDSAILALRDGLLGATTELLTKFYTPETVVEKLRGSEHWNEFLGFVKDTVTAQYNEKQKGKEEAVHYTVTKAGRVTFSSPLLLTDEELLFFLYPDAAMAARAKYQDTLYEVSSVGSIHFEPLTELTLTEIAFFLDNQNE